jgi:hypothetical protein
LQRIGLLQNLIVILHPPMASITKSWPVAAA